MRLCPPVWAVKVLIGECETKIKFIWLGSRWLWYLNYWRKLDILTYHNLTSLRDKWQSQVVARSLSIFCWLLSSSLIDIAFSDRSFWAELKLSHANTLTRWLTAINRELLNLIWRIPWMGKSRRCRYKAFEGVLYPSEAFLFLHHLG